VENINYEKIMIATDGSKQVEKAIEAGIELAKLTGAKLYAVYVIAPASYSPRDCGWEKSPWRWATFGIPETGSRHDSQGRPRARNRRFTQLYGWGPLA
jgi:hypothetical protein